MDRRRINLVGQTIGHLIVIGDSPVNLGEKSEWKCRCICGKEITEKTIYLRRGGPRSCGCIPCDRRSKNKKPPSKTSSKEYNSYACMKARCLNPANIGYKDYGGRGIKVCERWINSFDNFYADMGERPSPRHSLDRINVNGNYEPSNCRWSTPEEQCRNTRRTRHYKWKGEMRSLPEICSMEQVPNSRMYYWLASGSLSINEAVERSKNRRIFMRKVKLTCI